jgi:hypothetical protein
LGADGMTVSMGEFGAEADKFAEKVTKWIAGFEMSLSRVSFLSVAVAPASSREDAYAILAESVKSLKITPAMRDLLYRVNWRGNTAHLEEGYLNRLAAWSSFQLTATAGISGQRDTLKLSQRDFARIDLDINTPPERAEPLPQSKLPSLFLELVALAKETVAKGECMT